MGNLPVALALVSLSDLEADSALNQAIDARHYYFDEPKTSQNFEPDTFSFQRD